MFYTIRERAVMLTPLASESQWNSFRTLFSEAEALGRSTFLVGGIATHLFLRPTSCAGGGAGGNSTTGEESGLDALSRRKVKLDCGYRQDPETLGERRTTKEDSEPGAVAKMCHPNVLETTGLSYHNVPLECRVRYCATVLTALSHDSTCVRGGLRLESAPLPKCKLLIILNGVD